VGACALAQALSSCRPPIHTLYLSGNHIAEKGAEAFAKVLSAKNTVLSTLKLDSNKLGPQGAKSIAENSVWVNNAIKNKNGDIVDVLVLYPRSLTDLDLSSNGLMDDGAKFAAAMIKANSILTKLNISHNSIGNRGMHG
jgi:Ran GTPase-activating protein (RanGAP) involved in mRNA processing and transport